MDEVRTTSANDGTLLSYRRLKRGASGTALVMLHGLASNLTRWTELIENLNLIHDWDLLRVDLRGHGTTSFRGKISHDVWAEDLHVVMAHEGYTRAVLIGHSLGAQLGLHFALRYPQHTAGLVLIDPVFPDCLQGSLALVAKARRLLWVLIRAVWLMNAFGLKKRRFPALDLYTLDREMREMLRNRPELNIGQYYARPMTDIQHLPLANYLQDLYEVTRPLPPLSSIVMPVLVLLSQGASVRSLADTRQRIAELPKAETVLIAADHWLLTEKPDEARRVIEAWCDRITL